MLNAPWYDAYRVIVKATIYIVLFLVTIMAMLRGYITYKKGVRKMK